MKLFVTGGSGFIGTAVVQRLLDLGIPCCNYDVKPPIDPTHHGLWVEGDLLDQGRLNTSLTQSGADHVIHLAAKADILSTRWEDFASIHRGTENLLRAIDQASSVQRLANISTQLVIEAGHRPRSMLDFRPYTIYGEAKAYAEAMLLQWNTPVHWFTYRPANIWGPNHPSFADAIWKYLASGSYLHPGGKPVRRSYGFVENTADQIVALLRADPDCTHRRAFYGADAILDSAIWVDAFSNALIGRPARRLPTPLIKLLGLGGDVVGKLGIRPPIDSGRAMRMTIDYPVPVEPTLAITGAPRVSFEEGVAKSVEWLHAIGRA